MKIGYFSMLIVYISINSIIGINCSKENKSQEGNNANKKNNKAIIYESKDTIVQKSSDIEEKKTIEESEWFKEVEKIIFNNKNCVSRVSLDSIEKLAEKFINIFKSYPPSSEIYNPELCNRKDIDLLIEKIILGTGYLPDHLLLWLPIGGKGEFSHQEKVDSVAKEDITTFRGMFKDCAVNGWNVAYKYREIPLRSFFITGKCEYLDTLISQDMDKYDLINYYSMGCDSFGWN